MMTEPVGFTLTLPVPPSVNRFMGKLGNSSPDVRKWMELANGYVYEQKPLVLIKGPFILEITWPISCWDEEKGGKFDADNRVKPLLDYLQKLGIIENDKLGWLLHIGWGDVDDDSGERMCRVDIWPKG